MNIFINIIIIVILILGFILSIKYPLEFILYWSIIGSGTDACGIVGFFNDRFSKFGTAMNVLLIFCMLISLMRYCKQSKRHFDNYIFASVTLIAFISVSTIAVCIIENTNPLKLFGIICTFGPPILIIWMSNYRFYILHGKNVLNYVKFFICIQIVIAFLIVYLPDYGVNWPRKFCGSNYASEGIYNRDLFYLNIKNLLTAFTSKYKFNGLGQFHNSNDMGFYGAAGMMVAVLIFQSHAFGSKIVSFSIALMSIILWCNSSSRGPLIGIIIGLLIYTCVTKKKDKVVLLLSIIFLSIILIQSGIGPIIASYLLPDKNNVSYTARSVLRLNGLKYMQTHFLFGAGGVIIKLTRTGIDPHELPLRIACLFGIHAIFPILYIMYLQPVLDFIVAKRKYFFSIVFYFIVIMVSITNNYCDVGLFWIVFSESICMLKKQEILDEKSAICR